MTLIKNNLKPVAMIALAASVLAWMLARVGLMHKGPLDSVTALLLIGSIVLIGMAIHFMETSRQRKVRTVYLSDSTIYNPEAGFVGINEGASRTASVASVLRDLRYGFELRKGPNQSFKPAFQYAINTRSFRGDGRHWKGEVHYLDKPNSSPKRFRSKSELEAALD